MRITPLFVLPLFLVACATAPSTGEPCSSSAPKASLETYRDEDIGFTIEVPTDWTVVRRDHVVTDTYEATGTAFEYPAGRDRTTLYDAKVHIAALPTCPAQDGGEMEDINGILFTRMRWSGVGAGNLYAGETYAKDIGGRCIVATLYTHSCNLGPDCDADHRSPGDLEGTLFKLRSVLRTLQIDV